MSQRDADRPFSQTAVFNHVPPATPIQNTSASSKKEKKCFIYFDAGKPNDFVSMTKENSPYGTSKVKTVHIICRVHFGIINNKINPLRTKRNRIV